MSYVLNAFTGQLDNTGVGGGGGGVSDILGGTGIDVLQSASVFTVSLENSGRASTTTNGNETKNVKIIDLDPIASIGVFTSRVTAFEVSGGTTSCSYILYTSVSTDGVTAKIVGTPLRDIFEDNLFFTADANVVVLGNSVYVRVVGVISYTINWKIETTFTES